MADLIRKESYDELVASIKEHVQAARQRASLAANQELIGLYWRIGREILDRQQQAGWGAKVVDLLAADLKLEFPEMKGLSRVLH